MFVTKPSFFQWMPEEHAASGSQHWRAMLLSTEAPFYLVRFRTVHEDELENKTEYLMQSMIVGWERELIGLVEAISERVVSVGKLFKNVRQEWECAQIKELWHPSSAENGDTGPLLYLIQGVSGLHDSFGKKVIGQASDRKLIIRLNSEHRDK